MVVYVILVYARKTVRCVKKREMKLSAIDAKLDTTLENKVIVFKRPKTVMPLNKLRVQMEKEIKYVSTALITVRDVNTILLLQR